MLILSALLASIPLPATASPRAKGPPAHARALGLVRREANVRVRILPAATLRGGHVDHPHQRRRSTADGRPITLFEFE